MIYTTLNEIRAFDPSKSAWSKLLSYLGKAQPDDEPLPLVTVLDSNGLEDAIWCLRVRPDIAAEFAQWCADRVDGADDRATYWAAEAAYYATLAAEAAEAAHCGPAAETTDWADDVAGWAADAADWADKLRELLSCD